MHPQVSRKWVANKSWCFHPNKTAVKRYKPVFKRLHTQNQGAELLNFTCDRLLNGTILCKGNNNILTSIKSAVMFQQVAYLSDSQIKNMARGSPEIIRTLLRVLTADLQCHNLLYSWAVRLG